MMSRLSKFGLLAAFAAMIGPVWAQTSTAKSASGTRVEHVAVRGTGDATEVEIQTSGGAVAPDTQAIRDPDRIIIDFPGAIPSDELHALELKVNSGALKSIRARLFFNNPPITRIVLDLAAPRSYHILTEQNAIVVKLGAAETAAAQPDSATLGSAALGAAKLSSAKLDSAKLGSAKRPAVAAFRPDVSNVAVVRTPRLHNAILAGSARVAPGPDPIPVVAVPPPAPTPPVTVTYIDGMLSIHADKATLAQVLYEVQMKTQAEIAIPAGAEQEHIIADLGPGSARDVLSSLLNGSPYNFIFVGNESTLERVILTRRDPNIF